MNAKTEGIYLFPYNNALHLFQFSLFALETFSCKSADLQALKSCNLMYDRSRNRNGFNVYRVDVTKYFALGFFIDNSDAK